MENRIKVRPKDIFVVCEATTNYFRFNPVGICVVPNQVQNLRNSLVVIVDVLIPMAFGVSQMIFNHGVNFCRFWPYPSTDDCDVSGGDSSQGLPSLFILRDFQLTTVPNSIQVSVDR